MAAAALLCVIVLPASAEPVLPPVKDRLFSYGKVLASEDGGAYRLIDYDEMRDINGRDEIPERRVRSDYVSLDVRRSQQDLALQTEAGRVTHVAVGRTEKARVIVVFLHGQGGSRKLGVDDFTFGGNFNRVKKLLVDGGGLYLSPDFSNFGPKGASEIAALVQHYAARSPGAPVVLACGSMGGQLCWLLARARETSADIDGYMLLGSMWDEAFLSSPAFRARRPVFFGHGTRDTVFPVERQKAFFETIRKAAPGYPARFVAFDGGTHGTPIRMSDWRETLNWIFSIE
ncbi:MAG: alpha/beta fold hydrolase [Rhizobiaceae bacterium]|nr:alpha/beta fold hydrolase [Rhizobiaceae bacterium]MCV0408871.1 alpha/beta fold hydrolase [Rhizobiaceae bacterium]